MQADSARASSTRNMVPATKLRVAARTQVAEDVISLTLVDPAGGRLPTWTPGSHIDLVLPTGVTRQYSLCGDRWDPYAYRVAVLRERQGRGGSEWLHANVREGGILGFSGPRNHFPLWPAEQYLFIAGGIGITPMLPMIEHAERTGRPWRLLYGGRRRASMAFVDELEQYVDRVHIAPQDEVGLLDLAGAIASVSAGTKVYSCGPAALLDALESACRQCPPHTLHTERFEALAQGSATNREFTARLERSGRDIHVAADTALLHSLNDAGIAIVSSCLQGTCGTCEVAVLEGTPDHRDSVLGQEDRRIGDCMMACVSRAYSDRITLDL
ncbi:PDR/VanB family oxidoreductase [Prescottella defluvii]